MANKNRLIIGILVALVVVLGGIIIYTLVISPAVTGYTVEKQQQGVDIAFDSIVSVVSQCQVFSVSLENNQTLSLFALECLPPSQRVQEQLPQIQG